jgi:hypothetical protein
LRSFKNYHQTPAADRFARARILSGIKQSKQHHKGLALDSTTSNDNNNNISDDDDQLLQQEQVVDKQYSRFCSV